ncbi:universal stress protein [Paraburkholderia aromaticivorans]|uniref:Universal stress protein UspA n=1 Tax=Paraburkholderia aromaticivorans TaxID=2026199 RepID=A0A248VVR9_9BURK|nr:universal stress protein [Paraburkholderia aromaticivorans]ASW03121.1 universal stress protein UspA [Paraburkholderia aromaticivorans]
MNPASSTLLDHDEVGRILIAVDASPASLRAAAYVQGIAAPGAHVRIVSVAEDPRRLIPLDPLVGVDLSSVRDELLRGAEDAVTQAQSIFSSGETVVDTEVIDLSMQGRDLAHALLEAARTWRADLLVVGTRQNRRLLRWLEGTVSEPLARICPCSILVVPVSYERDICGGPKRMLFAVDGSSPSRHALRYGLKFATKQTSLRLVHILDQAVRMSDFVPLPLFEDALVKEGNAALAAAAELLAGLRIAAESAMISTERTGDDVPHAIVREADHWNADLVVMGTHGRRGISRWLLGSVASRVLRITHVPVLLVRPIAA